MALMEKWRAIGSLYGGVVVLRVAAVASITRYTQLALTLLLLLLSLPPPPLLLLLLPEQWAAARADDDVDVAVARDEQERGAFEGARRAVPG